MPIPVMVLAYNEARHIRDCLDSIHVAEPGYRFEVFVMANGCTDRTSEIVLEYARTQPLVHLVDIALGDKCNAWNVFIHETVPAHCPDREVYIFMNGDATVVPGSFAAMLRALRSNPRAHAAAAVPVSGRNVERDRTDILDNRRFVGNLYSLRGSFVDRIRQLSLRIPLGLEGDDGLIGALTKWDLAPEVNSFDDERVVPCADAAFAFEPISPFRLADWSIYWKRAVRYGRRCYEFELLRSRLKERGIAGLPRHIAETYTGADVLRLRWQGLYTIANLVALRDMRRVGSAHRSAAAASGEARSA